MNVTDDNISRYKRWLQYMLTDVFNDYIPYNDEELEEAAIYMIRRDIPMLPESCPVIEKYIKEKREK